MQIFNLGVAELQKSQCQSLSSTDHILLSVKVEHKENLVLLLVAFEHSARTQELLRCSRYQPASAKCSPSLWRDSTVTTFKLPPVASVHKNGHE